MCMEKCKLASDCLSVLAKPGYFGIALIISFFFGKHYAKKQSCFEWNEFAWNSSFYFLGFASFYATHELFYEILKTKDFANLMALIFLFIFLFLWGVFCLSGRGVGYVQAGLERGISILVTLKGIHFRLPPPVKK